MRTNGPGKRVDEKKRTCPKKKKQKHTEIRKLKGGDTTNLKKKNLCWRKNQPPNWGGRIIERGVG